LFSERRNESLTGWKLLNLKPVAALSHGGGFQPMVTKQKHESPDSQSSYRQDI
jgi:hypothetical protein